MHIVEAKTVLTPQNGLNIYKGGPQRCIFSPLRAAGSHVDNFDDVEVRKNADGMLESVLRKKRNKGVIIMGTLADPYVPEEEELELTRKCLFVIKRYDFGVSITTKSSLIRRDLDILEEINEKTKAVVTIPFPTTDSALSMKIDPDMAPVSERIKLIEELSSRNIPVIVQIMPILPYINDTEESVTSVLNIAAGFGAFGIEYGEMRFTLSPGSREYFYKCLEERFPEHLDEYVDKFKEVMKIRTEEIASQNIKDLMPLVAEFCFRRDMLYSQEEVRNFRRGYENKQAGEQLSFF